MKPAAAQGKFYRLKLNSGLGVSSGRLGSEGGLQVETRQACGHEFPRQNQTQRAGSLERRRNTSPMEGV